MDLTGSPHERLSSSATVESEAKRRKLRKGTHSCWECKRRKIRCIPVPDGPCQSCRQRGTACINQEISEGEIISSEMKNPMVRVEALIIQLAKNVGGGSEDGRSQPRPGIRTPGSTNIGLTPERTPADAGCGSTLDNENYGIIPGSSSLLTPASQVPTPVQPSCPGASKWAELSRTLYATFPSQEDGNRLCTASNSLALSFYQVNTRPHNKLEAEGLKTGGDIGKPCYFPTPNTHPVILGRQMLIFASLIQQLGIQHIDGLSEPPRTIMKRLADTAINLVTTNEELLGTTEGIECVILEGVFQYSCGNLRRAWLAFRRALMVGQLMGINRPHGPPLQNIDPSTKINPQFMWFRIVYMDRFLSMMLGLPQGTPDTSMGSDAAMAGETPMGRLERTHAVIAARILERKDRDPLLEDLDATKEIDAELLKIAKSMPPKFWLPPNFSGLKKDTKQEFWETLRLSNQLVHYNIINQLHLPYLLRSGSQPHGCKYSKMACVNASREILTRYITYSNLTHFAKCCQFFAVPASMTLLLAHLDSHHHQEMGNYLAHQRLSDRAMMEKVLETMENAKDVDVSTEKGENLLQCLLHLEAEAAEGQAFTARCVQGHEALPEDSDTVRISIPYFGVIKITREGMISKEAPQPKTISEQDEGCDATFGTGSVHASNRIFTLNQPNVGIMPLAQFTVNTGYPSQVVGQTSPYSAGQQHQAAEQFLNDTNDFEEQNQYLYPGLTAGIEDWAFQGVDNAFFDSLMMGTDVLDEGAPWLPDWQGGENPSGTSG